MHQHTHQHAFTASLHRSLIVIPTLMGTRDSKFNTHLPKGTSGPSFAPVTAFHRATQKSFRSTKRGRWAALHVCIAWKIYYHKLKRMQQKSNSHQEPEYPAASLPDSVRQKESEQTSCRLTHLDSPYGHSGETAENANNLDSSCPADLHTSSPCRGRTTRRENVEQPPNLHWKEKPADEKITGHKADTAKDSPLRDKSWDRAELDRKRPLEWDSFITAKRAKQEIMDDQFVSSKTLYTTLPHVCPSSHTIPVKDGHVSDPSVLYPNSSRCSVTRTPGGLVSYQGAEMYPYPTVSWEPTWGFHNGLDPHTLKDYSVDACKAIRIPVVAQRQKETSRGFFAPPLYLPLALRQQETVYFRGRECLHSLHKNCLLHHSRHELPHPGFLATSYPGP